MCCGCGWFVGYLFGLVDWWVIVSFVLAKLFRRGFGVYCGFCYLFGFCGVGVVIVALV